MCFAQTDSTHVTDSVRDHSTQTTDTIRRLDSVVLQKNDVLTWNRDTTFFNFFKGPLLPKPSAKAVMQIAAEKPLDEKDDLFFTLVAVFAFVGMIRFFFPRYIQNIFKLLFQSSFRQKQTRDQLLQDAVPSILLNLLFFGTTGLFIAIALDKLKISPFSFWQTFLYASVSVMLIYIIKYLFLLFFGWIFNVRQSVSVYSFIVFLINKVIAVILLPLLLLAAFSGLFVVNIVITVAVCVVSLLFIYRYIATLSSIRGDLRVNALHFFIYLCAVEVAPLLVIFKLLANQIGPSI